MVVERTRRYVAATVNTYAKWGVKERMLNNEGGRVAMLNGALLSIIEVGDIDSGLKRWSRSLAEEYINGGHTKLCVSLDEKLEVGPDRLGRGQEREGSRLPGNFLVPEAASPGLIPFDVGDEEKKFDLSKILKTDVEVELFSAVANTNNLKEAAELVGLTHDEAKRINNRVWNRAYYHYGKKGYFLSARNISKKKSSSPT